MNEQVTLQLIEVAFGDGTEGPSFKGYELGSWNGFAVVALPLEDLVRFYTAASELDERDEEGNPIYSYEVEANADGTLTLWTNSNGLVERSEVRPHLWVDGQPLYSTGGGWALVDYVGAATA